MAQDNGAAFRALHQPGNFPRGVVDIGQVGMAVAAPGGRADGDEDDIGLCHRLRRLGGEIEAAIRFQLGPHLADSGPLRYGANWPRWDGLGGFGWVLAHIGANGSQIAIWAVLVAPPWAR